VELITDKNYPDLKKLACKYYVCYKLARKGWNCVPTPNATIRTDIICYSQDGKRRFTINLVIGNLIWYTSKNDDYADYLFICSDYNLEQEEDLELYIMKIEEIRKEFDNVEKKKDFIKKEAYEKYKEKWDKVEDGF